MTQETGDGASGGSTSVERGGGITAFDAVATAAEEGVFRLDADGRFESVNDAVVDRFGYDRGELIGEGFSLLSGEEDVEAVEEVLRELRSGEGGGAGDGRVYDVVVSVRTASGEQMPCELRLAAVEADGRFDGAAGVLRTGVDRRRDVEGLVRERSALTSELDEALDRVSDAFFALDADGRFTYVNERAGELLEREPGTLVGEAALDEFPEAEDTPFVDNVLRTLETGAPVEFEEFYGPLSAWFKVRAYPSETGVSVYFRDVTEEKRRESVLEQYETVVEAVEDGLYAVDDDYRFTLVNDAYCRLTGYDRGELLGEHISTVVDAETVEMAAGLREELVRGEEESGSVEVEIERADGERVTVESRYAPMPGEEFGGTVGVVRDVSERKAFEETLTALNEASRELHAAETDEAVGEVVLRTLTDVLDLSAATVFRYDEGTDRMVPEHQTSGAVATDQEIPPLPAGDESLTGHVFDLGEFRSYDDIRETPYVEEPKTEMRSGLFAPIGEDRILVVGSTEPGAFDERTERLVELLAGNAASALERQEREREVRESERRYRTLVDNFPNGAVALYDEECHYVAVGGQMYDRIDLSPEDAVGMTVGERLSGQIAEALESVIQRAFEGESEEVKVPYDGRAFRLQSLPIRDDDGDVTLAMVVTQDVTERERAEEALAESERRFRTMMEQSPLSTQIFDPDGNTLMVNPAWEELWQAESEDVGEYNVLEDDQLAAKGLMPYLEKGFEGEATQLPPVYYDPDEIGKEGRPRWIEAFVYPVVDESGDIREVVLIHNDVTESRDRERELEQYETIVETVDDGVYVLDGERFVFVNEAFAEMVDYDREELIGADVAKITTGEYADVIEEEIRRLEQGEVSVGTIETEIVTAEGERVPAEARFSLFPLEEGGHGRVGIVRDVSDRKERERELERYETALDTASDVVVTIDEGSTIRDVNPAVAEVFGYEPDELLGEPLTTLMPERMREQHRDALDRYLETGEARLDWEYIELPGEHRDGHEVPLAISFGEFEYDGERFFTGIIRDNAERKERERELAEQRERYRGLVENAPVPIATYDAEGRLTFVNDAAVDLIGVDEPDDLVGEPAIEFIHPDERGETAERMRQVIEDREPAPPKETTLVDRDGEVRYAIIASAPITQEGEPGGQVVLSDVTDRKEYERRLVESEQRNRTLIENFPNGAVALVDRSLRYQTVGGSPRDIAGTTVEELEGSPVAEVLPQELADELVPNYEAALRGESREIETEFEGRAYQFQFVPVRDEEGDVFAALGMSQDVTERRRRERALEESEERYRTLVESYPRGAVAMFDEDLRYTAVGGQLLEAEGVDPEERIGQRIFELYPDDLVEEIEPHFRAALQGETNSFEVRYHGRDLFNYTLPVGNADGEVFGGMLVVNDVTEQREYERTLERFRAMIETVDDGVYTIDSSGRITMANAAYAEMTGYDREELIGMHASDLVQEEVHERARAIEEELVEGEADTARLTADIETADGETVTAEATFALLPGDDEEYERVAVVRDVTERVERERELERALDLLDKAQDIAQVGGWELDAETMEVYWTEQTFDLLGFPDGEEPPLDDALEEVYHPEDRLVVEEAIEEALSTGEPFDVEVRFFKDDEQHWARVWGVPEFEDDELARLRGAFQDVTERVERERELQKRIEQQQVVTDLGKRALEDIDIDSLFDEAVERVAETLDNEYAKVLELQPDGESLLLRSGVGWRDGLVGEGTVGTGDDSQAGHTIRSEEPIVVTDLETESRFSGPELLTSHGVVSGISTVIGPHDDPWGVLGTHDVKTRDFSQQDVNFVQSVANILATAIDRRARERQIEGQRNRMAAIVRLSEIVQEVDQAVIEQSSREEIDRLVCEHLVESGEYAAAWIGDVNLASERIVPRAVAGVPDDLVDEQTFDSTDDGGPLSPTATAAASGETGVARVDADAADSQAIPEFARERGYRSMAAVPLSFEDVRYGVLTLFSNREDAFEGYERTIIEQLGRTVGHAINAIDRKQALVGDSFTELELRLPGVVESLDVPAGPGTGDGDPTITVEGTVATGGDTVIQYVTVTGVPPDEFETSAAELPAVESVRHIGGDGPDYRYEVTYSDPPITSTLTSYGGRIESLSFDVPDLRVTVALPTSTDVRQIVESLRSEFPDVRIDAQRTVTREGTSTEEYRSAIEDALTERQRTALMTAFFAGYFEWSRDSTGEEVAETLGVSPSTFHQHLRAAQRKVIATLFDDERPA